LSLVKRTGKMSPRRVGRQSVSWRSPPRPGKALPWSERGGRRILDGRRRGSKRRPPSWKGRNHR